MSIANMQRYIRQMALPDFGAQEQKRLSNARILMIGAGGLGSAALPYLAGAGIGHITIVDHDEVSESNLHRQTIYKTQEEANQSKAELAAQYLRGLNPNIDVQAQCQKLTNDLEFEDHFDLILDGSDNFETKSALNALSIQHETTLLSASVLQYEGQAGLFVGYAKDKPCYHCLFPELPTNARNCNEAGVLGTAAGLTGLYQAHMALLYLAGFNDVQPGDFLSFNFKTFETKKFNVPKNPDCTHCAHDGKKWTPIRKGIDMIELLSKNDLQNHDHIVVDVRTDQELIDDPVQADLHIELSQIPERMDELPQDKLLAFLCAGNVRSRQAADYLHAMGFKNVCVLDKFSL